MSLIGSILGLLLVPMKARTKDGLADELERANFALNHWRNAWHVLWAENERLQEERHRLRAENERLQKELKRETDFNLLHLSVREAYEQQMRQQTFEGLGQVASQVAANAALFQQQTINQLGQLQQARTYQSLCTCVPSRGQAFGVHVSEPLPLGSIVRVNENDLRSGAAAAMTFKESA